MTSILLAAIVAAVSTGWPQPGYGPGHTFFNPESTHLSVAPVARWEIPTHGDPDCEAGREPLVAGGSVLSSDPGGIGAYDPATGHRRWHVELDRRGVTRMAVWDGRLVVLSYGCDRRAIYLTGFDVATGARRWEVPVPSPARDMIVDRGVAVVDSRPADAPVTTGYHVDSGEPAWQLRGARGDGLLSAGGRVLLRTDQGARAVDVTTGRTRWQTTRNWHAVGSDPAGTRFYVGDGDEGTEGDEGVLTSVDAATGRVVWTSRQPSPTVTADGDRVYLPRHHSVVCLDAHDGRRLWSVRLPAAAGQPVRAGDRVYAPSGMGQPLTIVDARSGRNRTEGVPGFRNLPPTVADHRLLITDGDRLTAYF